MEDRVVLDSLQIISSQGNSRDTSMVNDRIPKTLYIYIHKSILGTMDVKFFKSNDAINEYIENNNDYGTDSSNPFLCFCVAVTKIQEGNYRYNLRFNTTGREDDVYDTNSVNERTIPLKMYNIYKQR